MAVHRFYSFWIVDGNNGFVAEIAISLVVKTFVSERKSGPLTAARTSLRTRNAYFLIKRIITLLNDKIVSATFANAMFHFNIRLLSSISRSIRSPDGQERSS